VARRRRLHHRMGDTDVRGLDSGLPVFVILPSVPLMPVYLCTF
jgi:hypothetical protein